MWSRCQTRSSSVLAPIAVSISPTEGTQARACTSPSQLCHCKRAVECPALECLTTTRNVHPSTAMHAAIEAATSGVQQVTVRAVCGETWCQVVPSRQTVFDARCQHISAGRPVHHGWKAPAGGADADTMAPTWQHTTAVELHAAHSAIESEPMSMAISDASGARPMSNWASGQDSSGFSEGQDHVQLQ